jgi:hypothetical protein
VVILGVGEEVTESVDGQSLVYGLSGGGAGSFISDREGEGHGHYLCDRRLECGP